jgi:benzoylformate decarboxylase
VPPDVELLHVSPAGHFLGRVHPTRLGLVGDPAATIAALLPLLHVRVDDKRAAAARVAAAARRHAEIDALDRMATAAYHESPMHPVAVTHALVRALPANTPLVDDARATGADVRCFHHPTRPGTYFACRGNGLGWGMPAAAGVSLGLGRAPVLCVVSDRSAMHSPQMLWTAVQQRLPVVFAVMNNWQSLFAEPPVDFITLATSMGVPALRVRSASDAPEAVTSALARGGPHLLDLPVAAP